VVCGEKSCLWKVGFLFICNDLGKLGIDVSKRISIWRIGKKGGNRWIEALEAYMELVENKKGAC
jgi:hypothetical protein